MVLDIPVSSRMIPISGPTEVIAALRLMAIRIMPAKINHVRPVELVVGSNDVLDVITWTPYSVTICKNKLIRVYHKPGH
jgi:hypothetical protein